jgi:multisubunit Na+/H+ antiporter MnhB subunit
VRGDLIRSYAVPAGIAGALSLALGLTHLLPGVAFWDTGEMQTVGPVFGTAHPTGYPAYVILGWIASILLQPIGEPALRMNVLSAILLGAATACTTVLCIRLTGRPILGFAGGLVFAVTPEAWYLATHADAHAFHVGLLALMLLLLVVWGDRWRSGAPRTDRWLVAAAVVFGVSLGNQALTALLVPGIALYVLATDRRILRRPLFVVGCLVAAAGTAALLYLQLPLAVALGAPLIYGRPGTLGGFLYVVLGEQFGGSMGNPFADPTRTIGAVVDAVTTQLGWLALAVPVAAVVTATRRPRYFILTAPAFVLALVFAAVYDNAEIDRYHVGPVLIAVTWLVVAAGWVVDAVAGTAGEPKAHPPTPETLAWPSDEASALPALSAGRRVAAGLVLAALVAAILAPALARLPVAEDRARGVEYLDARSWLDGALAVMDPNATVISWWAYSTPLWYGTIVQGRRPDLRIVDDRTRLDQDLGEVADVIRANLGKRPVYVVRRGQQIQDLEDQFVLEQVTSDPGATIYRVVGAKAAGQ